MADQSFMMDFSGKDRTFVEETLDRLIEIAPSRGGAISEIRMTATIGRLMGISTKSREILYRDVPVKIRRWPHTMTVEVVLSEYQ